MKFIIQKFIIKYVGIALIYILVSGCTKVNIRYYDIQGNVKKKRTFSFLQSIYKSESIGSDNKLIRGFKLDSISKKCFCKSDVKQIVKTIQKEFHSINYIINSVLISKKDPCVGLYSVLLRDKRTGIEYSVPVLSEKNRKEVNIIFISNSFFKGDSAKVKEVEERFVNGSFSNSYFNKNELTEIISQFHCGAINVNQHIFRRLKE
jgi:hypothetical protein